MAGPSYLGFDLSTQQLKGIVVRSDLKLVQQAIVDFDADLSKYGIVKGVLTNPSQGEVFAPTAMWLEALDLVLERLQKDGLDFSQIKGVSGAGMQHGTVFWSEHAEPLLAGLRADQSLIAQLQDSQGPKAFSQPYSPNWQDASTQAECDAFDAHLGNERVLAEVTGSKAHHRFSGPQILRLRRNSPVIYQATSRISLVSSFLASIFLGKVAPIDIGDVCGMNLWDIPNQDWHESLLQLAAGEAGSADLKKKLGPVALDGGASLGQISNYFVQRFGIPADCTIAPFTGDNPATILSLPLQASDAIVSLGTSTTFLMSTPTYKPDPAYHFMVHPTTPGLYMFMLCYKNGSLARERVRDALNAAHPAASRDPWKMYNKTVTITPPLSQAAPTDPMKLGLYFPLPEIVPNVPAGEWHYTYTAAGGQLRQTTDTWTLPHDDARAILESQFLSLRLRSAALVQPQRQSQQQQHASGNAAGALLPAQPHRIHLVGGASANPAICTLAGEVLGGADGIYKLDVGGNACALGAAYKAVWAVERESATQSFEAFVGARWREAEFVRRVHRGYCGGIWERYGEAMEAFARMEALVLEGAEADTPAAAGTA